MDGIETRFAEPEDASQIADLFRGGFQPDIAQLFIYGSKGAPEYIRMQLAPGIPPAESAYFVAQTADGIAGAAELRRRPDWLLLNYIAVRPSYRGQGIGAILFAAAVGMSGVRSGRIELDVLDHNVQALRWYGRLGFAATTSSDYLDLAPPRGGEESPAYVAGLPQADLSQERFGFSKFQIVTGNGTFSVGRIGDSWFRLLDPAAAGSRAVFTALDRLDPGRRIFAVVPASSPRPAEVIRLLAKTHRMEIEIARLTSSLSNDCQKSRELV